MNAEPGEFAAPAAHPELATPVAFTSVTESTTRSLSMNDPGPASERPRSGFDTMEN